MTAMRLTKSLVELYFYEVSGDRVKPYGAMTNIAMAWNEEEEVEALIHVTEPGIAEVYVRDRSDGDPRSFQFLGRHFIGEDEGGWADEVESLVDEWVHREYIEEMLGSDWDRPEE